MQEEGLPDLTGKSYLYKTRIMSPFPRLSQLCNALSLELVSLSNGRSNMKTDLLGEPMFLHVTRAEVSVEV